MGTENGTTAHEQLRLARLRELVALVAERNPFQAARLAGVRLASMDDLRRLPLTSKEELLADQAAHPPHGTNLTYAPDRYTHVHQTSGTLGATLWIPDTAEDWAWMCAGLGAVLRAAGVGPGDRVALAYSFGPYLAFWAAYGGTQAAGAMAVPLGGMDSVQRLQAFEEYRPTAAMCTPTYAVHLARTARSMRLEGALASVRRVICGGEPGASLPAVRAEIEAAWDARCFDQYGLSESGPCGIPCAEHGGIHLREDEFVCEILDPSSGEAVAEGELGELVVTALGRTGYPAIRYRTGDSVRAHGEPCPAGHPGRWLSEGILGRIDDMVVIRGMNVFPTAIEQLLRDSAAIGEFRITFYRDPAAMDEVKVEVELARPLDARAIQARMRHKLGLRVRIVPVQAGVLPVQQGKARRVHDLRRPATAGPLPALAR
jgi:phenylacetate-CoA ligase